MGFGVNADGRPAGEAYANFPNAQLAQKALDERQNKEIKGRYARPLVVVEFFDFSRKFRGVKTRVYCLRSWSW